MSVQDKIERILKEIHLLFSNSRPYGQSEDRIVVEKQKVFALLERLNLAIYEAMDQYEVTSQRQELAERRCEKRGEEIIQKARKHADDIYAASIMYTDDAINRICYIMEDADEAIQKIFRKMNMEMGEQKDRVRKNQLELTGQLQDFADTDKYVKLIQEVNRQLEKERRMQLEGKKAKRIQNEGKSYSAEKPEIKVNPSYFAQAGSAGAGSGEAADEEESLAGVTGKAFADGLRRRAARKREEAAKRPPAEDGAEAGRRSPEDAVREEAVKNAFADPAPAGDGAGQAEAGKPEVKVHLDAEYFKWKEAGQKEAREHTGSAGQEEERAEGMEGAAPGEVRTQREKQETAPEEAALSEVQEELEGQETVSEETVSSADQASGEGQESALEKSAPEEAAPGEMRTQREDQELMMGESQGLSEVWETVPNESQESAEVWETVPNGDLGSSEAWETETNESQRSFGSGETASNESQGSFGSWETAPNESQGSFGAWGTAPNESVSRTLGGNGERNGSDGWISAEGEGEPLGVAVSEEMSGIEEIVELQDLPEFHKPQESQGKKARRFLFGRK